MLDYNARVHEIETLIEGLPKGYISNKHIKGRLRKYLQWTENGKKMSKYLDDTSAAELEPLIQKRRALQQELKELVRLGSVYDSSFVAEKPARINTVLPEFKTNVLVGENLRKFAEVIKGFNRRDCFDILLDYLEKEPPGKVFILYGLRRTGKTTLIRQALMAMPERDFNRAAFIQVSTGDSLGSINFDLKWLLANDYKYVFIDEVTFAEDFIEGAALFSDIYAASGIKVVLSGTDSLGFVFSGSDELYDRCIMLHTTFIPYREFERVLGIHGIDEYIRYGGTMSLGGKNYNEASTFRTKSSADEYVDSAIAKNIQHSLRFYQDGGHFRNLARLYDNNELTSAINRVVEDINHRFTIDVLTKEFVSNDLGISRRNLRKDKKSPTDILDRIDIEAFTEGLKHDLEILNKQEQTVEITDDHREEIKEYLDLLDLTVDIRTEFIPVKNGSAFRTAIAQPGLRYAQAEALVSRLLLDKEFQDISAFDRKMILDRIMNEIRGRMLEDIVLLETGMVNPGKRVFRLQFAVGEFDMVVADPVAVTCELYEIKHSTETVPDQCKNLLDSEKSHAAEFRYGKIVRKAVIYRGENAKIGDIEYINVEDYLKRLR